MGLERQIRKASRIYGLPVTLRIDIEGYEATEVWTAVAGATAARDYSPRWALRRLIEAHVGGHTPALPAR